MTATTTARQSIADAGRYPSLEQRRDALLEIAEAVTRERGRVCRPISLVVPLIVPTLVAASVTNVLTGFDVLVGAVVERARFVADPDGWLTANDLSTDKATWERMDDSTLADVDTALDDLMGARS